MKYYVVEYSDGYDYQGIMDHYFSNMEAARECADWYNMHPSEEAAMMFIHHRAAECIVPDQLADTFVPPMTEEEYQPIAEKIAMQMRGIYDDPDLDMYDDQSV